MPTALITGASTGIGRTTALRLAGGGWTVFAGVRDSAAGERLLGEAVAGQVIPLTLDVTDAAQIAAAAKLVREQTGAASSRGGLDALVNNAGIGVGGPLELVSPEDLRMQFEVNVFGQVAVTRALLPSLRAARGRIVLVSSIGGRVSVPFNGPYAASKHAIEALGDALRGELYNSNIHVSLVEPGSVRTPIWDKARDTADGLEIPPELQREYGHVPAAFAKVLNDTERRGVSPEQVAATIERALTARRPRARYLVGRDARGMVLAHALLPSAAFDRVLRRVLGV
ncbi:MAG TPA: SDR family oxidoreductase [Solirubrobacteraceae bacterium]|jgi:NAD(P)-dependent dehydrogenase (short-subunit alcohol dehydrogenase family)|nr:SDR family oxidoreductase [Solirubrobacteraceae bacterium]